MADQKGFQCWFDGMVATAPPFKQVDTLGTDPCNWPLGTSVAKMDNPVANPESIPFGTLDHGTPEKP